MHSPLDQWPSLMSEVVAHGAQAGEAFPVAEAGLEVELIRQVLVVEARGVDGLLDVEAALGRGEKDVGDGGDDAGAAGGAEDVAELAVFENDGRGHGARSGRLPGAMALAGPWMRPYMLGTPCFGGEVVHLVVEEEAERAGR